MMGTKTIAQGNAIGKAMQNPCNHLDIKLPSKPVLNAVNTPDIINAMQNDMPRANNILVRIVGT